MKKRVICVLGMHRSGTSILTKIIGLMGVYLGKPESLAKPQADNPDGFWEHTGIVKVHEKILSNFNRSWESSLPLPSEWWKLPEVDYYKNELINIIKSEFNDKEVWAWKDPRTCLLIPLWKEISEILDLELVYIIPIRNPIDVANSINKRDNISLKQGVRIWYYYMLHILHETNNYKKLFISFDELFDNLEYNIKELEKFIGLNVSMETTQLIFDSVKIGLRHSKSSIKEVELIGGKKVCDLFKSCIEQAKNSNVYVELSEENLKNYGEYAELMEVENSDKKSSAALSTLFIESESDNTYEIVQEPVNLTYDGSFNLKFEIKSFSKQIRTLKWRPLEGRICRCEITKLTINDYETTFEFTNASKQNGKIYEFFTANPICHIKIKDININNVAISGKVSFFSDIELQDIILANNEPYLKLLNEVNETKEQLQRYEKYYNLLNKWLDNISNKNDIISFLKTHNLYNISIYGFGEIAKRLYNHIKNSNIKVICFIENNAEKPSFNGIPLLQMENYTEFINSDIIIITPIYDYVKIKKSFEKINLDNKVISLEEIVDNTSCLL